MIRPFSSAMCVANLKLFPLSDVKAVYVYKQQKSSHVAPKVNK